MNFDIDGLEAKALPAAAYRRLTKGKPIGRHNPVARALVNNPVVFATLEDAPRVTFFDLHSVTLICLSSGEREGDFLGGGCPHASPHACFYRHRDVHLPSSAVAGTFGQGKNALSVATICKTSCCPAVHPACIGGRTSSTESPSISEWTSRTSRLERSDSNGRRRARLVCVPDRPVTLGGNPG